MMGSFITRGLVMVLGYTYPAYECFKTVEKNKPEIENLRFWCQYWIIAAMLTVFERFGDAFISWVPMYEEAKLAFFIYLWYPRTKGTTYVYQTFLRPYLSKHETEIDHNLLELRVRAGDMAVLYWQKAASYGQTRFFEILQYVASQSSSPRPLQQQQQTSSQPVRQSRAASAAHQPVRQQGDQAPPHGGGTSPTKQKQGPVRDAAIVPSSQASVAPQAKQPSPQPRSPSASQPQGQPKTTSSGSAASGTQQMPSSSTVTPPLPSDAGKTPAGTAPAVTKDGTAPVSENVVIEDSIRVTRGRLRRIRGIGKQNGV
ncbi:putative HVA22-like protein g isoform X2 [Nymphaea colorata]|nr:putative HVA22-like protein g isoform X2 [Nymphaea colorata]XP_031495614.1 putative HVA22-like protein g isoform X2 [Nymphaea colorata]XP_031495615.1 putative HVA22-like protein g isoform X2 [Nymphaea colorata]XP_049935661.1 putative HVA22-like protein g isoform X2 [Nymphaea colorata]